MREKGTGRRDNVSKLSNGVKQLFTWNSDSSTYDLQSGASRMVGYHKIEIIHRQAAFFQCSLNEIRENTNGQRRMPGPSI